MKKINTTKVNYKKIEYMGEIYHVWQYGKEIAISDNTGWEIRMKTDILNECKVLNEFDVYTLDPEEHIHKQFCNF